MGFVKKKHKRRHSLLLRESLSDLHTQNRGMKKKVEKTIVIEVMAAAECGR